VAMTTLFIIFYITMVYESISLAFSILFLTLFTAFFGFSLVMKATITFFNSFYEPPEGTNTPRLIFRRLLGVPAAPIPFKSILRYPFVLINIASVDDGKFILENESVYWLGGPAILIVFDGTGVYIERGNQFSRTLGPGIVFLDRYERVRDIVDLRPQTMSSKEQGFPRPIASRTKDGIKIEFNIEIKFHILRPDSRSPNKNERGNKQPEMKSSIEREAHKILDTPKPIYAGDLEAIKKAVERTSVRYRDSKYSEAKWRESVWGAVSGKLAGYVTQYYLDQLLVFDNTIGENSSMDMLVENQVTAKAGQLLSGDVREIIRQELDLILQANLGVTLSDLRIINSNIPPEIDEQYRQFFRGTDAQTSIKRGEGNGAVERIRIREEKRARAHKDLLTEIADGFKNIDPQNFADSVLLSLSSILDQSLEDTAIPSMLAKDNLATLEQLRDFLNNKDEA
jgi:regulator of protease activity HflC (stomatin/prohibitin superfamily)